MELKDITAAVKLPKPIDHDDFKNLHRQSTNNNYQYKISGGACLYMRPSFFLLLFFQSFKEILWHLCNEKNQTNCPPEMDFSF